MITIIILVCAAIGVACLYFGSDNGVIVIVGIIMFLIAGGLAVYDNPKAALSGGDSWGRYDHSD